MKPSTQIQQDHAQLQKIERKIAELENEQNNFDPAEPVEKLADRKMRVDSEIRNQETLAEQIRNRIKGSIEAFCHEKIKSLDPKAEKELEAKIYEKAGEALAVLRAVLEASHNSDFLKIFDEMVNRFDFPSAIKSGAAGYRAEAVEVVYNYMREREKNARFAAVKSNPGHLQSVMARFYGQALKGDFSFLEG